MRSKEGQILSNIGRGVMVAGVLLTTNATAAAGYERPVREPATKGRVFEVISRPERLLIHQDGSPLPDMTLPASFQVRIDNCPDGISPDFSSEPVRKEFPASNGTEIHLRVPDETLKIIELNCPVGNYKVSQTVFLNLKIGDSFDSGKK